MDQALGGGAFAGHEGQGRQLILERQHRLLQPGLLLRSVGAHHPQLIRMLLPGPLQEPHHRLHLAPGVGLGGAHPPADAPLAHEVDEVQLRSGIQAVPGEVDVLGGAGEDPPRPGRDANGLPLPRPCGDFGDRSGTEGSAPMGSADEVAWHQLLDRALCPICQKDPRARNQALIFIPHHAQVVVMPGQMLHQQVLGAVGVLVLVHQDVAEALGVDLLQGRVPKEPLGPQQQVIEVAGPVLRQALLVELIGIQDLAGPAVQGLLPGLLR